MIDVLFVVLPATLLLDLAGPAEAFRLANQWLQRRGRRPAFRLRYAGPHADAASSVGLALAQLEPLPESFDADTWIVLLGQPSGAESPLRTPLPRAWSQTRRWLAQQVAPRLQNAGQTLRSAGAQQAAPGTSPARPESASQTRAQTPALRVLTVCAGALLAADAGLLAGRRCTTHHEMLAALQQIAPSAQVLANRVFVVDGAVASSAGITAGIDLALHLIAQTCGDATAAAVAQTMVVFQRRGPDEPELSPLLAGRQHLHPAVHRVQDAVCEHPAEAWPLARMAAFGHVTPRHLARLFAQHVGCSPHAWLSRMRIALVERGLRDGLAQKQAVAAAGIAGTRQWRRLRRGGVAGGLPH